MELTTVDIKKAVIRSQHCQRNFDLDQSIPEADIDTLVHAATNCPSSKMLLFISYTSLLIVHLLSKYMH